MANERHDRNYDTKDLNKVFAIGSIVLFITVLAMVVDDYSRQWKGIQRDFHRAEAARTRREIQEAEKQLNGADMKRLQAELGKAQEEVRQKQNELEAARKKLDSLDGEWYGKDLDYRFAKANYDAKKYDTEIEIDTLRKANRLDAVQSKQADLDALKKKMEDAQLALEVVTAQQNEARAQVATISGSLETIQTQIERIQGTRERLQKKLDGVRSSFTNWLLNAPMLDFMAPTLQVRQVVLPKLRYDINFLEIPRVDRCTTCHTVIDQPGHEQAEQPYRTHPNLKLYLDPDSKHPMEEFGCTICHAGRDRGTSFSNAAHTPDNEEQRKEWEKKYHYEEMHYWEMPMFSRSHSYSGCYQCHQTQTNMPEAQPLDRGLRTVEVAGCTGCHLIKGMESLRKVGPDLAHLSSKTDRDWAFRWIKDPRSFRSSSRMPSIFKQSNQTDGPIDDRPAAADLNDAEIDAMVTYLWDKSTPLTYDRLPGTGIAARGKDLVHGIGCLGCHTDNPSESFPKADSRAFGPNLFGLASKTSATWVYHWLKDPKHYWKDTFMPSLRLTNQEALDITAYLMSMRHQEFEKIPVPEIKKEALDWLTRENLRTRLSMAETLAKMQTMTEKDKKLYLGERTITKYGCFGCHVIKGFENAQRIGTELTEEGSKSIHRFDFALESETLEHSVPAWLSAKLEEPRRFDRGKIKTWDEKLKMPNFHFTEEELRDVVTVLLGLRKSSMDSDARRVLTARETIVEEGRRIVRDQNCTACHVVWKEGGAIRSIIEDPGYHPPILDGEGEKVIPLWLFNFLKEPTTIRPWLNVRMPSFGLNDHETVALTKMFAYADNAEYPFETEYFRLEPAAPALLAAGAKLFNDFKCLQCHVAGPGAPERDAADLAPNLSLSRSRLRPLWIEKWLRDPQILQPGTRMPGYFPDGQSPDRNALGGDAAQQIRALRYHVLSLAGRGIPVSTENE